MNSKILSALAILAFGLLAAGCDSTPTYHYPITYRIPIGNSQVTSAYGPQNLNVSATQDVTVQPGVPLYYQVVSPVPLTLYIFDKYGSGPGGNLLGQMQGMNTTSSVTPNSGTLEFVFSAAQANTGGTVQFTISDRPIAPAMRPNTVEGATTVTPVDPGAPGTTTTTTSTTTTTPPH